MPRIIDHDERKEDILRQALSVFEEKGLKETSLALIAERCGISRPILYQYFSDKNDIFYYAVKVFTDRMLDRYIQIAESSNNHGEKLKAIFEHLLSVMLKEKALLGTLTNYYLDLRSQGDEKKFDKALSRRTIQFKRLLHAILSDGENKGTLKKGSQSKTELFFQLCQSMLVQMAFFNYDNQEELQFICNAVIEQIVN